MEGRRFDDMARALAFAAGRRGVLKTLAGAALGGLGVLVRGTPGRSASQTCGVTGGCCNGRYYHQNWCCTATQPCGDGSTCCLGRDGTGPCTNLDAANCGRCGHRCGTGESCCEGVCRKPGSGTCCQGRWFAGRDCCNRGYHTCSDPNQTCCYDSANVGPCADLSRDPQHCGRCGNRCPSGTTCSNGQCGSSGGTGSSGGGSSQALSLAVPRLSQKNGLWAGLKLGNSSKYTIGSSGCFITSVAMLFNYYQTDYTNPAALNDALKAIGGFSGANLVWHRSDPDRSAPLDDVAPSGVTYQGSAACPNRCPNSTPCQRQCPNELTRVDQALADGQPVLAIVESTLTQPMHMVVITGRTGDGSYTIVDPQDGGPHVLPDGALAGSAGYTIRTFHYFDGP